MDAACWLRLLRDHRFAVDPSRAHVAAVATLLSVRNSWMAGVQSLLRRFRPPPPLAPDPLIVLGHWRCGTTLLHELLALDPRHTAPTTYACFAPAHFRVTEALVTRLLAPLLPAVERPMDRMPVGWRSPQEDEFALMNLGVPSLYTDIAFPRQRDARRLERLLDLPDAAAGRWTDALAGFLRDVVAQRPGRLVLKSPLHMGRIPLLLDLFPRAVFVHIVRNPYVVFASTMHLWRSLSRAHGLQQPADGALEELVFTAFETLHARLDGARHLIPAGRFAEIRYEDLVRSPGAVLRRTYDRLGLGQFDDVEPAIDQYWRARSGHETNAYELAPEVEARIARRWAPLIERHEYERPTREHHAIRAD